MEQPRKGIKGPLVILGLAIAIVATASTAFLGTWIFDSEREKRVREQDKELAEQAEVAWDVYSKKYDAGAPDMMADGGGYSMILDSYYGTFEREAQELASLWKSTLGMLKGYPFTDAEKDLPLRQLAHVLNPVDGRLWKLTERIDDLVAIEVGSQRVASPPTNYSKTVAKAGAIRDALFPTGGRDLDVEFEARVINGTLSFAGEIVGDEFKTLNWKPGNSGAMLRDGEGTTLEFATSAWGMLRIIDNCEPGGEGTYFFGTATIQITVEGINPFDRTLYSLPRPE